MGKKNRIILPEEDNFQQSSLFSPANNNDFFPPVRRNYEDFKRILHSSRSYLGVDYEFPPSYKASIVGISSLVECAAIPASPEIVREVIETTRKNGVKRVGHSVLGAEVRVEEVTTGLNISPDEYDDSMLSHYLLNQDLAKAPDKKEEDDAGALGFMGLWPCSSMVLDLPYWKNHRGTDCSGDICPTCDVFGYCAVDAYASIASFVKHLSLFSKVGLSPQVYEEFKELTYIAELMHRRGIKVDMQWVKKLEKEAEIIKEKMFPFETVSGKTVYKLFNPKSNQQVLEWFHSKKINLEDTTKKTILKALEKEANKYGFNLRDEDGKLSLHELQITDELPEVLDALYREYEYKSSGKGLAPWFDKKYRDDNDFIHPRFITVGASTTRWSSSKPNFQNIPARGFGALVRAAIICSTLGNNIVKSDFSQLEARVCLYLGGFDHTIIGKDLFTWLVQNSNGAFEKAAQELGDKPRQVAKSLAHGSNYLEGIVLLKPYELNKPDVKKAIEFGSLRIYKDWEWRGKIVGFTGSNLADRLFGSHSGANRKRALDLLEDLYFANVPLRQWQKKELEKIENNKYIKFPTGHIIALHDRDEEEAKLCVAALGQGVSAQFVQERQLEFYRTYGKERGIPMLQVHDELDFEVPGDWSDKKVADFMSIMGEESKRLPGFKGVYKTIRGTNWLEWDPKVDIPGSMKPLDLDK